MDITPFVKAGLNTLNYACLGITESECEHLLATEVDQALQLNDAKICNRRYELLKISGTKPNDYQTNYFQHNHWEMMAGIRHFNLQANQPFVSVLLNDYTLDEKQLDWVTSTVRKNFGVFQPKEIQILLHPKQQLANSKTHQQWLVGSVAQIKQRQLPKHYDQIHLELVESENYFPIYREWYRAFHTQYPDFKDAISVNEKATMELSRAKSLLFWIVWREEKVGLIAGEEVPFCNQPALYFNEIVLTDKAKGKHLAAAAQRKLIDRFSQPATFAWGTIDAQNIPSTKTALSVGRKIIRKECFYKL